MLILLLRTRKRQNEHPSDPSPRIESHRAPRSASAQLSSSSQGLSAEADEVVDLVRETGIHDEDTAAQDFTRDTDNAGRAAAAAAIVKGEN